MLRVNQRSYWIISTLIEFHRGFTATKSFLFHVRVVHGAFSEHIPEDFISDDHDDEEQGNLFKRWMRTLFPLIWDTIPAYFIVVLILGAVRAWLFPAIGTAWADSMLVVIGPAIAGTLFIVPTAGEIPIVQSLMAFGLGVGPGAALLMTLPAISLPSLLMVRRVFPTKVLFFVTALVTLVGILSGAVAMMIF
jgi:uncharacterized membrane protein YraQ (UPF0718 family)